jgi:3-dehydro-L-gulonate 2-dehydrogenase
MFFRRFIFSLHKQNISDLFDIHFHSNMNILFEDLKQTLKNILLTHDFEEAKAEVCARIFAENTRDGVYSPGVNRFPGFIQQVKDGLIHINAEPFVFGYTGLIEHWDGQLAPGMYAATRAMQRAIELAALNGIGYVTLRNTNHWMRGGTYGWQAANAGYIGICATNTIANMPPWGGKSPTLGNNPLVISVPREAGHLVLDMAMTQFSYGKLQEYELNEKRLPVAGGYDKEGEITKDPAAIAATKRTLPVGFWKGAGLSLMLDVLVTCMSGGKSVSAITKTGAETAISQFFLCLSPQYLDEKMVGEIIEFTKSSELVEEGVPVRYPGEQTLTNRKKSDQNGIEVHDKIWEQIKKLGIWN